MRDRHRDRPDDDIPTVREVRYGRPPQPDGDRVPVKLPTRRLRRTILIVVALVVVIAAVKILGVIR